MSSETNQIQGTFRESFIHMVSFLRWILLCLVLLYLLSGIYSISSNEIGVLQRFGKAIGHKVQPGIHYAMPWPIDRVTKVPVRTINTILIDDFHSTSNPESIAIMQPQEKEQNSEPNLQSIVDDEGQGEEKRSEDRAGAFSYCITGDNNLVQIMCAIQFNITDPFNYLFRVKEPNNMLRNIASNTIIHSLSQIPIDEALTRGKQAIANYIRIELQKRLDDSQSGLSVSFVELQSIEPPKRVHSFFSDVTKAKLDRKKITDEAELYRNETIHKAQADATRLLQESLAYKTGVVLKAEGEVDRFKRLEEEAREKGDLVRNIMYIETMRDIFKQVKRNHIIFRDKNGKSPARLRLNTLP
jgi:membrane protease subunit HflK